VSPGFTMIDNDGVIARLPEIPASAVKVWLTLARRANRARQCWPKIDDIQRDTGLARKTVCDALKALKGMGLLQISGGRNHLYTVFGLAAGSVQKLNRRSLKPAPITVQELNLNKNQSTRTINKNHLTSADGLRPPRIWAWPGGCSIAFGRYRRASRSPTWIPGRTRSA